MTEIQILTSYETEINQLNDSLNKPSTDDSLFWINQAISKFVKTRFNGDQVHHTGYEQTEKRRNDLIKLFKESKIKCLYIDQSSNYDAYVYRYPDDFLYALNEDVVICDNNNQHRMNTCVFECTQDSFMYRVNNSLTDFHYNSHRARPLRIRFSDGCKLLTDKNYKIKEYTIGYIKKPDVITLEDPYKEYTDFEDHIMYEIVKMAAQMYLENKKDDRYQTISAEVLTQE